MVKLFLVFPILSFLSLSASELRPPSVFIEVQVSQKVVDVNQQAIIQLLLFTREDVQFLGLENDKFTQDFQIEFQRVKIPEDVKREIVKIKRKKYVKANVLSIMLKPKQKGIFRVDLGKAKVVVTCKDKEPETLLLEIQPFNLTVK